MPSRDTPTRDSYRRNVAFIATFKYFGHGSSPEIEDESRDERVAERPNPALNPTLRSGSPEVTIISVYPQSRNRYPLQ